MRAEESPNLAAPTFITGAGARSVRFGPGGGTLGMAASSDKPRRGQLAGGIGGTGLPLQAAIAPCPAIAAGHGLLLASGVTGVPSQAARAPR